MPLRKPTPVTPLTIIAALLGLCETVAGLAATQVKDGWTHSALVLFVIFFPVIVAIGFFLILWNRNFVLYPPSEYGGNPKEFVEAMKGLQPAVQKQIELVERVEESPTDSSAQFAVISSLIDRTFKQHLIFMFESNKKLGFVMDGFGPSHPTVLTGNTHSWMSQGGFSGRDFCEKLQGTGLVEIGLDMSISLTQLGYEFGRWLVANGEKADFYRSPFGEWGKVPEDWKQSFFAQPGVQSSAKESPASEPKTEFDTK